MPFAAARPIPRKSPIRVRCRAGCENLAGGNPPSVAGIGCKEGAEVCQSTAHLHTKLSPICKRRFLAVDRCEA